MEIILYKDAEIISINNNNSIFDSMAVFNDEILEIGSYSEVKNKVNEYIENFQENENEPIII